MVSSSCGSSSEATEKAQIEVSECRRLVCRHEACGWRAVALVVQSGLTACGCVCSGLLSLHAAGEIVLVVVGAAREQGGQFQLPPSNRRGAAAATRCSSVESTSAACSSARKGGCCDARVLRRADEAEAAILCMVTAEATVCARQHTCDSDSHAQPCSSRVRIVANLSHPLRVCGCCTGGTMSRRVREQRAEISKPPTKG